MANCVYLEHLAMLQPELFSSFEKTGLEIDFHRKSPRDTYMSGKSKKIITCRMFLPKLVLFINYAHAIIYAHLHMSL